MSTTLAPFSLDQLSGLHGHWRGADHDVAFLPGNIKFESDFVIEKTIVKVTCIREEKISSIKNYSWVGYLMVSIGCVALPIKLWAQEIDCFALDGMGESRNYISSSFQWENDIGKSDRWYTNGMKYSRMKNPECNRDSLDSYINRTLLADDKSIFLSSWVGGINMYTPENIKIANAQSNDRPWTGWAYLGREWRLSKVDKNGPEGAESYTAGDNQKIEVQVGVLGAWAHQDNVQRAWHALINSQQPQGWANQKSGELGVSLSYTTQNNFNANKFDAHRRFGFIAGNVVNQVSIGGNVSYTTNKLVDLDDPTYLPIAAFSGVKQIAPALRVQSADVAKLVANADGSSDSIVKDQHGKGDKLGIARRKWYRHSSYSFFSDIEGKLIASSTFISGTHVSIKPLVADIKFGLSHKNADSDLTWRLSRLIRSPEFKRPNGENAPWQKIWQLSLEWDWGWVKNPHVPDKEVVSE